MQFITENTVRNKMKKTIQQKCGKLLILLVVIISLSYMVSAATVVIDPGHGTSLNGRSYEDKIILSVGLKLKAILESNNVNVIMTRTSTGGQIAGTSSDCNSGPCSECTTKCNSCRDNSARGEIARQANADLFFRIHSNSGTSDGFFLIYPNDQRKDICGHPMVAPTETQSKIAADAITRSLVGSGIKKQKDPVYGTGSTNGIGPTFSGVPTATIEMYGHGNNPGPGPSRDDPKGATELYFNYLENKGGIQDKMAEAMAKGILSYLNLPYQGTTTPVAPTTPTAQPAGTPPPITTIDGQQYTTKRVEKTVPQGPKDIDLAWGKLSEFIDKSKLNLVWDNLLGPWDWRLFEEVYFENRLVPIATSQFAPGSTGVMQGYPGQASLGFPVNLNDCQITKRQPPVDSQSVGSLLNGHLINGMKSETDSFVSTAKNAYSSDLGALARTEYGTSELINMLEYTSCALSKRYGVKLEVKDRSLPTGGPTYRNQGMVTQKPPQEWFALKGTDELKKERYKYTFHTTHLSGRDADLGLYFTQNGVLKNKLESPCRGKTCTNTDKLLTFKDPKALAANWDLLKFMDAIFPLSYVAFDKYLIREIHQYACGVEPNSDAVRRFFKDCNVPSPSSINDNSYKSTRIRHVDGHANHYHIAILCPKGDQCGSGAGTIRFPQTVSQTSTTSVSGDLNLIPSIPGVNFYTYTTGCTSKVAPEVGRTEGIIIPDNLGPDTELIVYFHGHQLLSVEQDVKKRDFQEKILELKQKGKDAVFVWFEGGDKHISQRDTIPSGLPFAGQLGDNGRNWMKGIRENTQDSQFKCFYDEAIVKLNEMGINPTHMSFMGHSNGGNTLRNVLGGPFKDEPHLQISSTTFYDACYGSECKDVASLRSDQRGQIFAYYYDSSKSKTPEVTKKISGIDQVTVKESKVSHGFVPTNCFTYQYFPQLSTTCVK
jgi:N-acetylmuramoyl-L-alanine amidase